MYESEYKNGLMNCAMRLYHIEHTRLCFGNAIDTPIKDDLRFFFENDDTDTME